MSNVSYILLLPCRFNVIKFRSDQITDVNPVDRSKTYVDRESNAIHRSDCVAVTASFNFQIMMMSQTSFLNPQSCMSIRGVLNISELYNNLKKYSSTLEGTLLQSSFKTRDFKVLCKRYDKNL